MSRVAQNERLMQYVETHTSLDTDAVACLVMTTDPFFDGEVPHLAGLPDAKVGKSMTSVITQELQISAPNVRTTNWSMHIHTNPWTADPNTGGLFPAIGADLWGNYCQFPSAPRDQLTRLPSVAVWRGDDGNALGPFHADDAGNFQAIGVGMPDTYSKGVGRLIGLGIEYYDTTAPLYRQGSLRCYEQPSNAFETKSAISYATPNTGLVLNTGAATAIFLRRPPNTPQEANLLAGTVGWKAESGFYMVCNPIEAEIPAKTVDDTQPVIFPGDFQQGTRNFGAPGLVITGGVTSVPPGLNTRCVTPGTVWNLVPFNTKGCILTGLHPSHTGLLRVRYIYERFPSPDEADFSLAARPCAKYCPEYFEVKSRMMRDMPVAMEVGANGLGEWLYSALSWVFPSIKKGIHAITAPDAPAASQETKEIARLSKAVEKMASKPVIVARNPAQKPVNNSRPPVKRKRPPPKKKLVGPTKPQ